MCETNIKIAYIKKHVYKDREETTHVKTYIIYIYMYVCMYTSKISTMYVKMVTRPVYKKLKETPKTTRR